MAICCLVKRILRFRFFPPVDDSCPLLDFFLLVLVIGIGDARIDDDCCCCSSVSRSLLDDELEEFFSSSRDDELYGGFKAIVDDVDGTQ